MNGRRGSRGKSFAQSVRRDAAALSRCDAITGTLERDGIYDESYDPTLADTFETSRFKDKSITTTQHLRTAPLWGPAPPQVPSVIVQTVKDGKEVLIVKRVMLTLGTNRPVKSLLKRSPGFETPVEVKREQSRTKRIITEREAPIDSEVSRMSYNRPDHLVRQDRNEAALLNAELGIDDYAEPDNKEKA